MNILYFPIPKCANSSVRQMEAVQCFGWHPDKMKKSKKRMSVDFFLNQIYNTKKTKKDFSSTFTVIRNPYSRILSCYLDRVKVVKCQAIKKDLLMGCSQKKYGRFFKDYPRNLSFDVFVEIINQIDDSSSNDHFVSMNKFVPTDVDHIIRMEDNLSEQIKKITGHKLTTHLRATTNHRDRPPEIKEKTKKMIYERYKEDFLVFNY